MTITVTNIVAGPFTATGDEQVVFFAFKVFTPGEVEVLVGDGRDPIDPSSYSVESNRALDGQVLEGGTITLAAGAVVAGAAVRVVARPTLDQGLVFSDTGSRLRNLNEGLDRAALRAIRAQYDGLMQGIGPEIIDLAEAAGAAAGIEAGAAASADRLPKVQYPTVKEMLPAAGDGTTDLSATLARTDVGFFTLPPGDYRVKANCTISRPVYFAPGSRMTIDPGVTVTFTGNGQVTSDCRRQVFYGTGAVAGLPRVDVTWFAGDKVCFFTNNETVNLGDITASVTGASAVADLQRAFNAVRSCGVIELQDGVLTLGGGLVSCPVQASIRGRRQSSIFVWNSTTTNGFALPYERSSIEGFSMRRANLNVPSVAGSAIVVSGGVTVRDFYINGCYIGVNSDNQAGPGVQNFDIFNARNIGIALVDTNDPIISSGFIVTDDEYCQFAGASGGFNPVADNTLTGVTSGCQMRVKRSGSGYIIATRFYGNANKPIVGEVFNCSSGGSATLSSYTMNHELGGLRIIQNDTNGPLSEAVMLKHLDIIGGRHNITIDGAAALLRQGPSYNRASDLWLDSALESALLMSRTDGWTFTGVCIQSRFDGLAMSNVRNIRFIGSDIRHCSAAGAVLGAACNAVDFTSCTIADNRYGIAGNTGGHVYIANDATTRVTFNGGSVGRSVSDGITTDYGIVLTGSGGQLFLWGVQFGPTAALRLGAISGLSSLTSYTVDGCSGLLLKNRGSFQIATGQSASANIYHGLNVPVSAVDVRLTCSDPGGLGRAYAAAAPTADITSTTFKVRLYDIDAVEVAAARQVTLNWEVDLSYKI